MDNYPKKLKQFLESLGIIDDESQRIQMLVDYSDKFKKVPFEIASEPYPEENKVPFCESGAYVWTKLQKDNTLKFYFAVENPYGISAKALSVILDKTLSGETVENVLNISPDVIYKIFGHELSMGKNLGLAGIIIKIQTDIKRLVREKHS
jgi:cysteine desulfuration protein SufE